MKPTYSTYLECDHCGDVAVESPDGYFHEDMTDKCMSCGIEGYVSIDEEEESAAFYVTNDPTKLCNQKDCEECNKADNGKAAVSSLDGSERRAVLKE